MSKTGNIYQLLSRKKKREGNNFILNPAGKSLANSLFRFLLEFPVSLMLAIGIHDIWSKTISSKRRLVECDIWSIRRFADYDVWSTTTIGRKFVELRRNLVEIWSKTDMYWKNKKVFTFTVLTSPIYFHASISIHISVFLVLKALIRHF